jgi:hypothetical protein
MHQVYEEMKFKYFYHCGAADSASRGFSTIIAALRLCLRADWKGNPICSVTLYIAPTLSP